MLHEALDAGQPRMVGVAQAPGQLRLDVEGQAFLRTAGQIVQRAAHRPQEILGLAEGVEFLAGQQPFVDQRPGILDPVQIARDPYQRLQVAQAPLALLQVGFDHIARIAHLFVAGVPFGQLAGDELTARAGHHLLPEGLAALVIQRPVAPQIAGLQQGGADGQVLLGQAHAVGRRAGGVAHLQPQVPQHIQHVFGHAFGPRRALVGDQEQQVHVGERRQLAPAVAAGGHQGQPFRRRRVGQRVDVGGDEVEQHAQELVHQIAVGVRGGPAAQALLLMAAAHLLAAGAVGVAQQGDQLGAPVVLAGGLGHGVQGHDQGLAVDDGASVADLLHTVLNNGPPRVALPQPSSKAFSR